MGSSTKILIFIQFFFLKVNAQEIRLDSLIGSADSSLCKNISFGFLKDSLKQPSNGFSFNTLKILNRNKDSVFLTLDLKFPSGWQIMTSPRTKIKLGPGERIDVPIRLTAPRNNLAGLKNIVYASIKDENGKSCLAFFYITIQELSKWDVKVKEPLIYLDKNSKEVNYSVLISNSGNVKEKIKIVLAPEGVKNLSQHEIEIYLDPLTDSLFTFKIKANPDDILGSQILKMKLIGSDVNGNQKIADQHFKVLSSTAKQQQNHFFIVPLTLELIGQNLTNEKSSTVLNAVGGVTLEKNRSLFFSYRSNYLTNTLSQQGVFARGEYKSKKFGIIVGDQSEFFEKLIAGLGVKTQFNFNKNQLEIIGAKDRTAPIYSAAARNSYIFSAGNYFNTSVYYQLDQSQKIENSIFAGNYVRQFNRLQSLIVEGGIGKDVLLQNNNRININGFQGGLKYEKVGEKLYLKSFQNYSSPSYPGLTRGVTASDNEIKFKKGNKSISLVYYKILKKSILFLNGELVNFDNFSTDQYEIRLGYSKDEKSFSIYPAYVIEKQDSILTETIRARLFGTTPITKDFKLQTVNYFGRTQLPDFQNKNYLVYTNRLSILWRNSGIALNLDYGPNTTTQIKEYIKNQTNPLKFQLIPFIENNFYGGRINTRFQAEYLFDKKLGSSPLTYRADIGFNFPNFWTIKLFSSYSKSNLAQPLLINASIKKTLFLPIPGLVQFQNLKIQLFKDVNDNALFDSGDLPINNCMVNIGNTSFQTDTNGTIEYQNVKEGTYELDLTPISGIKGWSSASGPKQKILFNKKTTIYVPFVKSKFVNGNIIIDKDKYSGLTFDISNIRITAKDSLGNEYYTLTDKQGAFILNLPPRKYTLSINTNLFEEIFIIESNDIAIDLRYIENTEATFRLLEKKRKINIRKNN